MFNAPRPGQLRYQTTSGLNGSFIDDNPLASSVYDDGGLDPWSAAPTPPPPPDLPLAFGGILAEATVPAIYHKSLAIVDPLGSGETSVGSLHRVLATSSLPAATIDRIVNLVSTRPRVSKLEFFVALALVALAQSGKDISVEQVAAHAQQNTLPEPSLDLVALNSITASNIRPSYVNPPARSSVPAYSDDPWNTSTQTQSPYTSRNGNGATPSLISGGLPKDWWKRQENVTVSVLGQQGFILNRYTVYQIHSESRGPPVSRRYSEFVFLWDCLVRRYPFRILPNLPPKRISPDESFLEQRRKGLSRFLNFVVNHPVLKEDGVLSVFLSEPSFEAWRKHSSISLEEESASKRVDRIEEMSIPSDLEEKLAIVRRKISTLIEQWSRICLIAERILKRQEAGAADLSRLTITMNALVEVNTECWRGDGCELCLGVRHGLGQASTHLATHSEQVENRTRRALLTSLEAFKSQRDLYIAVRDLFVRQDRLSVDQVDRLRKRVEQNSHKLEGIRGAQKDRWQEEADKVVGLIERDQAAIHAQLARRVFIRYSMWHELRVVLHNRENTLLSQAVQTFAREQRDFADIVHGNWVSLVDAVESMPLE